MPVAKDVAIRGMEGEIFKVVVRTTHPSPTYGNIEACTAVHDQLFQRRIGGVRFVPGEAPPSFEDLTEVGELAEAMTWKSPLSGIPADGEKTVVYCPKGFPDPKEQSQILAQHLAVLKRADPGVIFGPDIHCGEEVMDRLAHLHGLGDHVSGLPQGKGGLSIDGQGYTARGLEAALVAAAEHLGWDLTKMSAIVQGFGAVGAHTANNLHKRGVRIQAVSSIYGALIATTEEGLDIEPLFQIWQREGDEAFQRSLAIPPAGACAADHDAIWEQEAEIFIPAARTDVLAISEEVEKYLSKGLKPPRDAALFSARSRPRIILEGANHPVTPAAESFLEGKDVFILPDYVVNCGGLLGCWADWVFREELEDASGQDWFGRLDSQIPKLIGKVVGNNVQHLLALTQSHAKGLRKAAHTLASQRRTEILEHFLTLVKSQPPPTAGREGEKSVLGSLLVP